MLHLEISRGISDQLLTLVAVLLERFRGDPCDTSLAKEVSMLTPPSGAAKPAT